MNHRLFLRVAAPALVIGLLLLGTCLASIRYIDRLQANLAEILAENVTGLQATQELEIRVRQLRFHTMIYLMDPRPARLEPVAADEASFEKALAVAHAASTSDEDRQLVGEVEAGYRQYQQEQARLRRAVAGGMGPAEFPRLADSHPVHSVVGPCQRLLALNKEKMDQTAAECRRVSREGHLTMLLLGLAGPLGGIAVGSNGRTMGGSVPDGRVLSVDRASELTAVRAAAGSMSSRK
jgi:hypothetical protein